MTTFEDLSREVAAEAEAEGPDAVRELRGFEREFAEARRSPAYWREMVWVDLAGYRLRGLLSLPGHLWGLLRSIVRT